MVADIRIDAKDYVLADAIFDALEAPGHFMILAKPPWSLGALAMFVVPDEDFGVPKYFTDRNYSYFLEVDSVKELWRMASEKRMSDETKIEFVQHYAMWDAYPHWFFDMPDALSLEGIADVGRVQASQTWIGRATEWFKKFLKL